MEATVYLTRHGSRRIYARDASGAAWTVTGEGTHKHTKGDKITITPDPDFEGYAKLVN